MRLDTRLVFFARLSVVVCWGVLLQRNAGHDRYTEDNKDSHRSRGEAEWMREPSRWRVLPEDKQILAPQPLEDQRPGSIISRRRI